MSEELEAISIQDQFESIIQTEDKLRIREFLNNQNISDVAILISEYDEFASQIISNMSMHRAVSVFKILDISLQKQVIKELP